MVITISLRPAIYPEIEATFNEAFVVLLEKI
jgi:hypothetical protein